MNAAPVFQRVARDNVSTSYHAWAEHYNQCGTCQQDDWMSPVMGERGLCEKGKQLFRAWVSAARVTPPKTGSR